MSDLSTNCVLEQTRETRRALSFSRIGYEGLGKRLFDVAVVVAILPILLPLVAMLALLVRLDGGPAFFAQTRIGKGGRNFRCYKLRTMRIDAEAELARLCAADPEIAREWDIHQKLENDPRITRVGAFLRRTSLDELPQFFNVLFGSMSLVGPRPFMEEQEDSYRGAMGRAYFEMRPGITGLWQVAGRSATAFVDRVRYDERYYKRLSLSNDIWLCLMTFAVVLRQTGR
ncbi:MAG: sugar transferase [Rhodobacteraceae bacterium]|jgi:lipopolysaccharide/colanic/teichoic acid biosynthesis glycosyltransferase|uniref:sugar transferase n=1 Tax=Thioclava sp. L04-15 TaxID=1915318 RepID=UPI000997605D|nr:sugar transferase [Thioclava sp. L04-15]OOY27133.1 exopolysaccharide biosynthesis protein [Thioclava sp. L04-15]TNE82927.1 MAG: sugar transferase [Paracoccaceae bacterium]TNF14904.1 MAG: sugar transferase [Paracoccaceae bacterium]